MCIYLENPAYVYVHEYPIKTRLYRRMASEKMAEFFLSLFREKIQENIHTMG